MTTTLPADLTLRSARFSDLEPLIELLRACDIADSGEPDTNPADILADWREPGFDLATDSSLLIASQGQIVGYTAIHSGHLGIEISPYTQIHPAYRGQELEHYLLNLSERRALLSLESSAGASVPRVIRAYGFNELDYRRLEAMGYQLKKVDWRMEIKFDEPPRAPQWPQGISARPYIQGQEERIAHAIIQEAFSDLAHRSTQPFEEWVAWAIQREDFDPSLLFLLLDGEKHIGAVLGFDQGETGGWVRQFAILKPWQGRGIGKQFLRHVFGEFYRRDMRKVGLIVDSENPSGATHFYQRVGMHVASQIRWYQKEV